jgi:hypothetical protein
VDGLTFTFHIRRDAKFHSGKPVTARDAEVSCRRVVQLGKTPANVTGFRLGPTPDYFRKRRFGMAEVFLGSRRDLSNQDHAGHRSRARRRRHSEQVT